jgi:acyl-CoA dehydrogenase
MDFQYTPKVQELCERVSRFMEEHVLPNEAAYAEYVNSQETRWVIPPIMETMKAIF